MRFHYLIKLCPPDFMKESAWCFHLQVTKLVNDYEDAEAGRGSVWPLPPGAEKLMATTPEGISLIGCWAATMARKGRSSAHRDQQTLDRVSGAA